jgi:hypothetical protein
LLPHPEPSVTVVNTHVALCLLGVRTRSAMQMQIDAMTRPISCEKVTAMFGLTVNRSEP